MKQYQDLVRDVLENGKWSENRTGIDAKYVFGYHSRYDLRKGFPLLTTKKMATRAMVAELFWFLEGSTDERRLAELTYGKPRSELVGKKTIWTANADKQGVDLGYVNNDNYKELGPVYGAQWRDFNGVDQIKVLIEGIKSNPRSRRHIISSWNVPAISEMALPPCHVMAQFDVSPNGELSCAMYQRSVDVGLGLPFNIASYALLTHMIAKETGTTVGDLVHVAGNLHIYENHIEPLREQLSRKPFPLPRVSIEHRLLPYGEEYPLDVVDSVKFEGYQHHPTIKMDMAV